MNFPTAGKGEYETQMRQELFKLLKNDQGPVTGKVFRAMKSRKGIVPFRGFPFCSWTKYLAPRNFNLV